MAADYTEPVCAAVQTGIGSGYKEDRMQCTSRLSTWVVEAALLVVVAEVDTVVVGGLAVEDIVAVGFEAEVAGTFAGMVVD